MTARGYVENLANRTVSNLPSLAIRPAISPDMLPDTFSSVESIAPTTLGPQPRSARHLEASVPTQHTSEKVPVTSDVKLQENSPVVVRENNDVLPAVRIEDNPSTPPTAPAVRSAKPSPPQPPAESKGEYKEIMMQDEKKPLISPAAAHESLEPARPLTPDNSKEITPQDKPEVVIVRTPRPVVEFKDPTPQTGTELAKAAAVATSIKPDIIHIEKEKVHTITTSYDNPSRAEVIQQGRVGAHPARQMQHQAYEHDQDTVTINIGRIEVRAVFPQKQGSHTKEQSGISLSQYLKLRSEGKI